MTHNERYSIAQESYLAARAANDKETMNKAYLEMYTVLVEIQRRYLGKYCSEHNLSLDELTFNEKVDCAVFYVLDQYEKKSKWKVDRISAYAHFGMLKALFSNYSTKREFMSLDNLPYEVEDSYNYEDSDDYMQTSDFIHYKYADEFEEELEDNDTELANLIYEPNYSEMFDGDDFDEM